MNPRRRLQQVPGPGVPRSRVRGKGAGGGAPREVNSVLVTGASRPGSPGSPGVVEYRPGDRGGLTSGIQAW